MLHADEQLSLAYIGLGSNLEDPVTQILMAFHELSEIPDTTMLKRSSLYKSAPVGRLDQPDFINAVAEIKTLLSPLKLLEELLKIEKCHGRIRNPQDICNAPRTLDMDLLLYENLKLESDRLTLPHPRMTQRAFVLYPLFEITPDYEIPGHGKIARFITVCSDQVIQKLDSY